jgi:hypothetical protein
MIRLVHLLRRAPGLSKHDFATVWRDVQGPLVASVQTDLSIVRYVQLHPDPANQGIDAVAAEARGGMLPAFDGVAEYWWKSADALATSLSSVAGRAAADRLVEGEQGFIDLPASPLWFAAEYPQVATALVRSVARIKSNVMRLHFALQPRQELGEAAARRYWLEQHGPLIRAHSPARGLIAYNQVHRVDCALATGFEASRGTKARPFLGHAESWFERPAGGKPPFEMAAAMDAAIADEKQFIDWSASTILVGKELVFIDREWDL